MIKLIMYKADGMRFCFDAISFEHGLSIAREKCFSMGLIGRYYVSSNSGECVWINCCLFHPLIR